MGPPMILLLLVAAVVAEDAGITADDQSQQRPIPFPKDKSTDENIIFSTSELVANVVESDGTELYLEAFKSKENDQILQDIASYPYKTTSLRFVSIGHPKIVNQTGNQLVNGRVEISALVVTPVGFHFFVRMLPKPYRDALALAANTKYQTSIKVESSQIVMLTPDKFSCVVAITNSTGQTVSAKGKVKTFRTDPLKVDFKVVRDGPFDKQLRSGEVSSDAVVINCKVTKRAQRAQTDQLVITSAQIDKLNLANKLFGPTDSVFVSRQQLNLLGREIVKRLDIFESYENDEFDTNFVADFLENVGVQNLFTPTPIAEVLDNLSPYKINSDIRPNEVIKDYSDVLKIETVGGKQIVVKNKESSSQLQKEISTESGSGSESDKGWGFPASVAANYAASKSNEWVKSDKSVDDQLSEININSQSAVKFQREGMQIVPKSLDVAQISRSQMSSSMKFSRIRRKLTPADFRRKFELSLPRYDATTTSTSTTSTTTPTTTTTTTSTPTTTTTSDPCRIYEDQNCQSDSDCCQWDTPEFKMFQNCGITKECWCVSPGDGCYKGFRCCDGSVCNGKCPPVPKFHFCKTIFTPNCMSGLECVVDSVPLALFPSGYPDSSKFGRCMPKPLYRGYAHLRWNRFRLADY